ncbi:MAG: MAPEG family protein [Kordiimonadaceae bacterium]|nr:MAPEG family protein [Kordiimonadaceae bacterium]
MTITLIAASFLGLLLIYLSYAVSKERLRSKTDIGDGDDPALLRAIRAQANLTEYAPLGLILIGLLETSDVNKTLVLGLAVVFVLGRYMHGLTLGKLEGKNPYRMFGTLFTWGVILVASIVGLLSGYHVI